MWDSLKGRAMGVLAVVLVVAWLMGIGAILGGVIVGTMLVIGLMLTIEKIPGFWAFACTKIGKLVTVMGTAYLAHRIFGSTTLMGMVAMAWSLILKVIVIDSMSRRRESFRAGNGGAYGS